MQCITDALGYVNMHHFFKYRFRSGDIIAHSLGNSYSMFPKTFVGHVLGAHT